MKTKPNYIYWVNLLNFKLVLARLGLENMRRNIHRSKIYLGLKQKHF